MFQPSKTSFTFLSFFFHFEEIFRCSSQPSSSPFLLMLDLVIVSLTLIVGILLLVIAFLTLYIIHERRKTTITPLIKHPGIAVPLLALQANDRSSGDHCNSATRKRVNGRQFVSSSSLLSPPFSSRRRCLFVRKTHKVSCYPTVT